MVQVLLRQLQAFQLLKEKLLVLHLIQLVSARWKILLLERLGLPYQVTILKVIPRKLQGQR